MNLTKGQAYLDNSLQENSVDAGEAILNRVCGYLGRFVAYPNNESKIAHALWVAHTHLIESFEATPRIAFLSPEPASGKTRALEVTETLVPNPVEAVNVTPAYLFRKVGDDENGKPTILYDEIDTVFGPRAKGDEEIRGLLNAGHRKGAVAGRCVTVGKTVKTEEISAYCAVALAGLGNLPDTIISRSIVVPMRRRSPNERVESYRRRIHAKEGNELREQLSKWCESISSQVGGVYPEMPEGVEDRNADVWEPLLAIADAAGGIWPEMARVTAVTLVTASRESTPSLGIRLLSDMRDVFCDNHQMFTKDILHKLNGNEDLPWGDLNGSPLDARRLGSILRKYIDLPSDGTSRTVRIGEEVAKGYKKEWLHDAWQRYLKPQPKAEVTSVTPDTFGLEDMFCPKCDDEGCKYCSQDTGVSHA